MASKPDPDRDPATGKLRVASVLCANARVAEYVIGELLRKRLWFQCDPQKGGVWAVTVLKRDHPMVDQVAAQGLRLFG